MAYPPQSCLSFTELKLVRPGLTALAISGVRNLMSRKFHRRQAGVLAVVVAFASLGGLDLMLVTSGGAPVTQLAVPPAALAAPVASSPVSASPPPASPAAAPPAPAAAAPPPPVTETPPPVVDGVRRVDVGSAHSPRLLQQLATSPATMPPPADAGALGVDVADYQHPGGAPIEWSQVAAAGYKFAFIKASEGDYYANPYYASDLANAKAAGLYATGYHFAIPNVSDGASQADYAVGNGGYAADGRTLPLALDIEYNPYGPECYGLSTAQMVSWLSAFTAEEQRLTGPPPPRGAGHLQPRGLVGHLHRRQHRVRRGPAVGGRVHQRQPAHAGRLGY